MKMCNGCDKEKDEDDFGKRWVGGKQYLRTQCRLCESKKRISRAYGEGVTKKTVRKQHARIRRMRAEGIDTERWILQDSRQSDKRKGRENDLDKIFIKSLIERGCLYCGEMSVRMTLDRIDNEKGHIKDNVVPACIRCNITRKNMPYEAWLVVARGMREAREKGLFGDWTGRVKKPVSPTIRSRDESVSEKEGEEDAEGRHFREGDGQDAWSDELRGKRME